MKMELNNDGNLIIGDLIIFRSEAKNRCSLGRIVELIQATEAGVYLVSSGYFNDIRNIDIEFHKKYGLGYGIVKPNDIIRKVDINVKIKINQEQKIPGTKNLNKEQK